jgi:RimJ/RimL family protein N-acetyltransferase
MQTDPLTVIETERLALRRATLADAPFLLRLWNDPTYYAFIGDRGIRTLEQAEAAIQDRLLASYARNGFGLYLVTLKATGELLGMAGLIRRPGLDDVDVGYAFLPPYWGQGYAYEAAAAALAYGRDTLQLPRVVAIVDPGNARSIHVLEKLGLRYEKMITLPGETTELKLFA